MTALSGLEWVRRDVEADEVVCVDGFASCPQHRAQAGSAPHHRSQPSQPLPSASNSFPHTPAHAQAQPSHTHTHIGCPSPNPSFTVPAPPSPRHNPHPLAQPLPSHAHPRNPSKLGPPAWISSKKNKSVCGSTSSFLPAPSFIVLCV